MSNIQNSDQSFRKACERAFQQGYDFDSWDRPNQNPYPVGGFLWKRWRRGRDAKEGHRKGFDPSGKKPPQLAWLERK